MDVEKMDQALNRDFSELTDKNRESVLELTKFLILTQNTIVPKLLNTEKKLLDDERQKDIV